MVRWSLPGAAILLPVAFFFSVLPPKAIEPNELIYLAYFGAIVLAIGLVMPGIGLMMRVNR